MIIISDEKITIKNFEIDFDLAYLYDCIKKEDFQKFIFVETNLNAKDVEDKYFLLKKDKKNIGIAYIEGHNTFGVEEANFSIYIEKKFRIYALNAFLKCMSFLLIDGEFEVIRFLVKYNNYNMIKILEKFDIKKDGELIKLFNNSRYFLYSISREEAIEYSRYLNKRY